MTIPEVFSAVLIRLSPEIIFTDGIKGAIVSIVTGRRVTFEILPVKSMLVTSIEYVPSSGI
jgi:hypothetical protein